MSVPFIEMQDVAFSYGGRPVLRQVSFRVGEGVFAALMGGSGSGKTTLLRLITGQLRPDSGRVLVRGRDLAGFSDRELFAHRRNMGVLFQFGALFTDLSVFENVAFPLREQTDLPEAVIRDLVLLKLNAVGLHGTADLMPSELSGGMARRVALARTIALDPALMLYDEPFTGLDPISLGVISELIAKINRALQSTSIMVTHDIRRSLEIVDQVVFLAHGEVVFSGSPEEMRCLDSPWVHQFVNGLPNGPVAFRYPAADSLENDLLKS